MQSQAIRADAAVGSDFFQPIIKLLTSNLSLRIAIICMLLVIVLDRLFVTFIFPVYENVLPSPDQLSWLNIDAGYSPIVWTVYLGSILASITVVVSLAAQSAPKLIDLYMENVPTMSYVWWTMACAAHCYTLKLLPEIGYDVSPSLVFNYHVLFPVFLFTNFPFVLAVLLSTKTHNVIKQVLGGSKSIFRNLAQQETRKKTKEAYPKEQLQLFEAQNQLIDLLTFTPYKEPKALIIEGLGELLRFYVEFKHQLPNSFFKVQPSIREDISFKTMQDEMKTIEETELFFEQKSLRLIGNVYITFLEKGDFDLSTLCVEQVGMLGRKGIELKDDDLITMIMVRLNTHLRFALKHGMYNNEPRNLYNLIFHYGLFTNALVEAGMVDRVKTCFFYLTFYNAECFKAVRQSPAVGFILDVIATEMQKIMIRIDELNWDSEVHDTLLKSFLLLDNPTGSERDQLVSFFTNSHGIRLLHIGLALHYMAKGDRTRARVIAKDTLQDRNLLGEEVFLRNMKIIFARLRFSGPTFWEDTDRGNLNIYYSPHADHLDEFGTMQQEFLGEARAEEAALKVED